ncbi:MAG TPA: arginase family protein, partial [Planctomycetota bacterium]|nr:arginase family protein [Planctomycetota bacterium]
VHAVVQAQLRRGKLPGVVGGDHSVPYGAIQAVAEHCGELGILHVDAHADLRPSYEGFRWSHASIMDNVLRGIPQVRRIVQVGVRDFSAVELEAISGAAGRVVTHFDQEWRRRGFCGESYDALCREAVAALPEQVYVSFDIDGLDRSLCPNTGTPVPGGLAFAEACHLLATVVQSGRRIVGFDLVETAPGDDQWDANVGARMLYKLCGFALLGGGPG